ncbi:hypothetical protein FIV50_12690 [Microbacterium foliorum]|uniref:Transposase n=1 Tax=Microbacterium foliorum TaxID=104336 RepID=A0A4Y5YS56_9MICO|nr:DUF6262 family protein [Microbacterium foliorum]QDE35567.1 hypothetical protein FIV50_12690 [Microbacterium foliorum]
MTKVALTARQRRVDQLAAARALDSKNKRARAIEACTDLVASGIPVTHTNVARKAHVSTWLTYNVPEIRSAIEQANAAQAREGLINPAPQRAGQRTTPESLHTDLLLAQRHVRELRDENVKLRKRLERQLGAELEGVDIEELTERVYNLERVNRELSAEAANRDKRIAVQQARIKELESENESQADVVRAMMVAANVRGR